MQGLSLKEYYDIHQAEYAQGPQVKARHILIKAKEGDKAEEVKALVKIKKIQEEMKSKKFAELASQYSEDPGSQKKGEDLGWFGSGKMVPEFEKAAFGLEPGKVSEPVKTNYGYHLIMVEEKKPAHVTTLEQAKSEIAAKLLSEEKIHKALEALDKEMKEKPQEALAELQKRYPGLKWEETGNFTMADEQVPKLSESEELSQAAFELGPNKPYSPRLFKVANVRFALKYKAAKEEEKDEKAKKEMPESTADLQRGRMLLNSWVAQLYKESKVTYNNELLKQSMSEGE